MNKNLEFEEIQQGSFLVLKKMKEIFEKNNWNYFLTYGTLIGAVRHKGFIPWDDDIDVWVPRADYEKFIDYCINNEQDIYPFKIIHYKNNERYIYPIARFVDTRYRIEYENAPDYGLGLFVDIYPLDGYNENDILLKKRITRLKKRISLCGLNTMVKSDNKLKNIIKIPYYYALRGANVTKLLKKIDLIAQKYSFDKYDVVDCTCWANTLAFAKKEELGLDTPSYLIFNGEKFQVPKNYDAILRRIYGDYMELPPKEEQVAHHYYKAYRIREEKIEK